MAAAGELVVGDPLDPATEVGPLIRRSSVDRVEEWVRSAESTGARILTGGERVSPTTYAPTVVADPTPDTEISTQEVFAPVVALQTYDDLDEAVRLANLPDLFFQASVFTNRLDRALDLGRRLHGMAVMVNDHPAFRVDWMPFGGHRESGLNLGGIGYSMRDMTVERMIVMRSNVL